VFTARYGLSVYIWFRLKFFSSYQYHSTIVPFTPSSTCFSYQKDKRTKLGIVKSKAIVFHKQCSIAQSDFHLGLQGLISFLLSQYVTVMYTNSTCYTVTSVSGRAMAQSVSCRLLTAEAWVRSRVSPYGICGGQSGTGTGFSPSSSVVRCQFHSTGAPLIGKMEKISSSFSLSSSQSCTRSLKAAVRP
jgi:hypothetical protein